MCNVYYWDIKIAKQWLITAETEIKTKQQLTTVETEINHIVIRMYVCIASTCICKYFS